MLLFGTYTGAPLEMKVGNATQEILRQPAHLLFAAGLMVDSMWEDWSRDVQRAQSQSHCVRLTYLGKDCTGSVITMVLATFGKMKKLWLCRNLTGMHSVSRYIVRVFHSCIHNQLHSCSTLLRPGTFPLCHHRLIRGCRTGAAVT